MATAKIQTAMPPNTTTTTTTAILQRNGPQNYTITVEPGQTKNHVVRSAINEIVKRAAIEDEIEHGKLWKLAKGYLDDHVEERLKKQLVNQPTTPTTTNIINPQNHAAYDDGEEDEEGDEEEYESYESYDSEYDYEDYDDDDDESFDSEQDRIDNEILQREVAAEARAQAAKLQQWTALMAQDQRVWSPENYQAVWKKKAQRIDLWRQNVLLKTRIEPARLAREQKRQAELAAAARMRMVQATQQQQQQQQQQLLNENRAAEMILNGAKQQLAVLGTSFNEQKKRVLELGGDVGFAAEAERKKAKMDNDMLVFKH